MGDAVTTKTSVFRNKNFSLLFSGVLVSNVAHVLFSFAISLFVLKLSKQQYSQETAAMIQAWYLALSGIILVLLIPIGGVMADRMNKVKIMYVTDFIRGFTIIASALSLILFDAVLPKLIVLFAMNTVLSINSSIFNPASSSLLRFIVSDEELQPAASYLQGSNSFQSIIGVLLGGIMYASMDIFWIFIINGIGYIISAITEIFIHYDRSQQKTGEMTIKGSVSDIKDGLKYLISVKPIFITMLMALGMNFFLTPIFSNAFPYFIQFDFPTNPSYLFDSFMSPSNWYSVFSVSLSLAAIIMSLVMSHQKTKESYAPGLKKAIALFTAVLVTISAIMIGYYLEWLPINFVLISIVVVMFMGGLTTTAFNIPVNLIIQKNVSREQLGKVSSVTTVLAMALVPVASLIAGVLISQVSVMSLYVFSSVGVIIVMLLYVINKKVNSV
ncbi:MAG TPA: MFS transporter [Bacillota bacterium]|nr:MFS transporter [Bacillota bacterium]HPQ61738.1 MFS transporter [Bacillota bacterium]HRX91275.1 MFS transporter [Candidatus Izemoplasmatales bacterium]